MIISFLACLLQQHQLVVFHGCLIGLVSLFNSISTLFRLFNAKAILLEEQYYLTHSREDKGVHTFPKGICPKVNIIARLENELAYYDFAVHRFNHSTTRTPPMVVWVTASLLRSPGLSLADLNTAEVCMVLIFLLISNSSSLFSKPTIIGITVTLMIHSFFSPLARSKYQSIFASFLSFLLSCLLLCQNSPDDKLFFLIKKLTLSPAFWLD